MNIPKHIAIIPDGNRRWAKEKNLPALVGHKKGFERTYEIICHANSLGLEAITFYAFSTENWNRAKEEVDYLMELFISFFDRYIEKFHKLNIRLRHLGDISRLSEKCRQKLKSGVELTKNNSGLTVQLALNYGGRDEIKRAVQKIIAEKITAEQIDESTISEHLDTADVSDPELIIRTSGEQRLSGFLLWQSEYAELYFPEILWPDFTTKEFDKSIDYFNDRQRRFGK